MAKQERAIRTRNALVESAAALFDRDGFEVASLATISARAGVSSGALHFHFPSKAALAEAVVAAAGERLVRITRERDALPLQALIDASHELVQGLRSDAVLRAGFDLSADPERTRTARDLRRQWREWVESLVVRAEQTGLLAPDVAARDVAAAVVAVAAGHEALGHQDPRWLENAPLTRFWAFLLPRVVGAARVGLFVASGDPEAEPAAGADTEPGSAASGAAESGSAESGAAAPAEAEPEAQGRTASEAPADVRS
ncbi:ScbR family autoregulator-binding transcription factor [Streptomyces sp. NPDC012769]|uniref:ScbR family autoregulator-binding transcription factor n=1 Tax=Streptomyces sp. NPDC012769 TaxID=3364848 RepID=UPI0036BEA5A3